mmetsp:Transcript_33195/g.91816  ORF Transcript_33195/g.91816 Transcript_33195/m.91816 type:complete len:282 (+) Transcript_33195:1308-2153(+)
MTEILTLPTWMADCMCKERLMLGPTHKLVVMHKWLWAGILHCLLTTKDGLQISQSSIVLSPSLKLRAFTSCPADTGATAVRTAPTPSRRIWAASRPATCCGRSPSASASSLARRSKMRCPRPWTWRPWQRSRSAGASRSVGASSSSWSASSSTFCARSGWAGCGSPPLRGRASFLAWSSHSASAPAATRTSTPGGRRSSATPRGHQSLLQRPPWTPPWSPQSRRRRRLRAEATPSCRAPGCPRGTSNGLGRTRPGTGARWRPGTIAAGAPTRRRATGARSL